MKIHVKKSYRVAKNGTVRKNELRGYKITGDNKETISLLLGMGMLDDGGIYCGVLKQGVFFDKKFKNLRKELINNYEVMRVIGVPQDDFLNTSTKTSILIFKNTGKKTKSIKFIELDQITNKSNTIGLNEINPQTKEIIGEYVFDKEKLVENNKKSMDIKYDNLVKKDFSLNYKDYIIDNIVVNDGFEVKILGDVCLINPQTKKNNGLHYNKYIEIGNIDNNNITGHCEVNDKNAVRYPTNNDILIASVRPNSKKIVYYKENDNIMISSAIYILRCDNEYMLSYLYYYIIYQLDDKLREMGNGSTYPRISPEVLSNFLVSVPKNIETIKIYIDYLKPCNETLQTLQTLQTQKEKAICGLIKLLTSMGKKGVDYDEYRFDSICKFLSKSIKYKASHGKESGKYKFYTSSQTKICYVDDEPMFKEESLIMGKKRKC